MFAVDRQGTVKDIDCDADHTATMTCLTASAGRAEYDGTATGPDHTSAILALHTGIGAGIEAHA